MSAGVGAETVERVFAALEREADMDGLVTASGARLGELVGISQVSASSAVRTLIAEGRVQIEGRVGTGTFALHLPDG